jgi:hypothetical protein
LRALATRCLRNVRTNSFAYSPWHLTDAIQLPKQLAADGSNMLAALTRKKEERILDLLERLDRAVRKAAEEKQFTDEING